MKTVTKRSARSVRSVPFVRLVQSIRSVFIKASKHSSKSKKRRGVTGLLAAYAVLILLAAIIAAGIAHGNRSASAASLSDPFSSNQRQAAGFTLYYPSRLPTSWQIDAASLTSLQQHIVNYRLFDANGGSVTITQQKTPDGFSFATLYHTFNNRQDTKTPLGQMTSGTIDDNKTQLASLVTPDGTWILLSNNQPVAQKDLALIFANFKASHD